MLGSLAFKAVRQQQNEAAQPLPFVFSAGDKLIHDRLRNIPEVAELRFPEDETVRIIEAVAVLESEDCGFGERTVENLNRRRVRVDGEGGVCLGGRRLKGAPPTNTSSAT